MPPRVTQSDLAARLGVHPATVSLALRNSPTISMEMRRRVQALAAELGYHPDPALSALMAYRSQRQAAQRPVHVVAYVTDWYTEFGWKKMPAHAGFHAGAERKAAQLGYRLEHFWLGAEGMNARRLSRILHTRRITGVLLATHRHDREGPLELEWEQISGVRIDYHPRSPALNAVTNHQTAMVRTAYRKALEAGCRRVGLVMPREFDEQVDWAWSAGFLLEQDRAGADRIPILYHDARRESRGGGPGVAPFAAWLKAYRPDVILAHTPFIQPDLDMLGLAVPDDMALIDLFLTRADGSMAGLWHHCERVGEVAMEQLAIQLQQNQFGVPAVSAFTYVEGGWVDGRTLRPPPLPVSRHRSPRRTP